MAVINEGPHAGGFILSLANGTRSLENVTIASGAGELQAGTVLGKITSSGYYVAYDNDLTNGAQAAAGILIHPVDATSANVAAAIVARDAEVNENELVWDEDNGTSDINAGITDLAALGIHAR